jgi:hypothetical protein
MTFGSTFGRIFSPTFQPKSQAVASASAWVPTDIAGCLCWLDFSDTDTMFTDAGSTKVSSDGNLVYQINDKSGNGKNAVQTTEARRWAYYANIKNSLSVIRRSTSTAGYLLTGLTSTSGSYTFFFAVDRVTGANWIFDTKTGRFVLATANSSKYSWNDGSWHDIASTTTGWQSIVYHFASGGNGTIYKNGSSLGYDAYTAKNIGSAVGLFSDYGGSANSFIGDAGEFILYDTALSDTDRGTVETYLNNKWAIY